MNNNTKELIITLDEAKRLYPTSDETMKKVFENTFGKYHFSIDICDRIQNLGDVEDILGCPVISNFPFADPRTKTQKSANALILLSAIAEAYDEGKELDWNNTDKYKWFPYKSITPGGLEVFCHGWYTLHYFPAGLYYKEKRLAEDSVKKFRWVFDDFWQI